MLAKLLVEKGFKVVVVSWNKNQVDPQNKKILTDNALSIMDFMDHN